MVFTSPSCSAKIPRLPGWNFTRSRCALKEKYIGAAGSRWRHRPHVVSGQWSGEALRQRLRWKRHWCPCWGSGQSVENHRRPDESTPVTGVPGSGRLNVVDPVVARQNFFLPVESVDEVKSRNVVVNPGPTCQTPPCCDSSLCNCNSRRPQQPDGQNARQPQKTNFA